MIDSRNNIVHSTISDDFPLPSPRFDEQARANAQAVVPIPSSSRVSGLVRRLGLARLALNARTKALALVIIAGLSVGAFGGTLLVNQQAPVSDENSIVVAPANDVPVSPETAPLVEANNASADEMTEVKPNVKRGRSYRRIRLPAPKQAYQVDVIR